MFCNPQAFFQNQNQKSKINKMKKTWFQFIVGCIFTRTNEALEAQVEAVEQNAIRQHQLHVHSRIY
jgi:hypothetical protein